MIRPTPSPQANAVLDVLQRLDAAGLRPPTTGTLTQQLGMKAVLVAAALKELKEADLVIGGNGKRGWELTTQGKRSKTKNPAADAA